MRFSKQLFFVIDNNCIFRIKNSSLNICFKILSFEFYHFRMYDPAPTIKKKVEMASVLLPNREIEDNFDPSIFDESIDMEEDDVRDDGLEFNDSFIEEAFPKVIGNQVEATEAMEIEEVHEKTIPDEFPIASQVGIIEKGASQVGNEVEKAAIQLGDVQLGNEKKAPIQLGNDEKASEENGNVQKPSNQVRVIASQSQMIVVHRTQSQVIRSGEKGRKRKSDTDVDVEMFAQMNSAQQRNFCRLKMLEGLNMETEIELNRSYDQK